MPSSVSSGDRKLLLIAAAAFVVLVLLGFLLAPASTDTDVATSYSAASGGAKAAFLLLQELGYHVERWQHSATQLKPEKNTVLIIADPGTIPDGKQRAAVEQFISAGGRVITNGFVGAAFLPENHAEVNPMPSELVGEFPALMPSAITRAAPKINVAPATFWQHSSGIPLYGKNDDTVATRLPHGEGDAIWLAAATPLTNAGIKETGNLEFLLASLGDKQTTHVLFDEYVHGYGEDETPEKRHPLMTALFLQSIVLALAALFTFSRRSGPLRPMPAESRLSPLEFVETLGGLYQQAHAGSVAVDVAYQRFHFWVTRRLGLANNASAEEIDRAVRDRWHSRDDSFLETVRSAASARYQPELEPKEALRIVQSLYSYASKLKLFPLAKPFSKKVPKERH
jgi:uncharacterized protein DUF4350